MKVEGQSRVKEEEGRDKGIDLQKRIKSKEMMGLRRIKEGGKRRKEVSPIICENESVASVQD